MKALFKIGALVTAGVALSAGLAGCGCGGCYGCGGNSVSNRTVTNSNWFTGTSYAGIQTSFIPVADHPEYTKEEIVYEVSFDGSSASNSSYSVEYKDGTFTTEFYAQAYDWSAKNIPEKYRRDESEIVYRYTTTLNVKVRYTLKKDGSASEWMDDVVVNDSYFRAAGKRLQPVYSRQESQSSSPARRSADTLEKTYNRVNAVYENYYAYDCGEVTAYSTVNGKSAEKVHGKLNKISYSFFDNAYLYTAVRSMTLSETLTQTVTMFSGANMGTENYSVRGGRADIPAEELKAISAELNRVGLYHPVTKDAEGNDVEDKGVPATAVAVNNVGSKLVGAQQIIWYASVTDPDMNTARATMLKIAAPLPYNLGILNYKLKEIKSTLWNE